MTRISAISLHKGGVGKTTVGIDLGPALSAAGRAPVALIFDQEPPTAPGNVTEDGDDQSSADET